jgi:hypothetical protein
MGDDVPTVEPTAFCELCGTRALATDLEACPRCGVLACPSCRPLPDACATCAGELVSSAWRAGLGTSRQAAETAAPAPAPGSAARVPPPTAPTHPRPAPKLLAASLVVATIGVLVAVLAGGGLGVRPGGEPLASAGNAVDGRPGATPPLTGDGRPSDGGATPGASTGEAAAEQVVVDATSVPVWQDILGAWHGQALAAIRNPSDARVTVDPSASHYAVLGDDGSTLAEGAFTAVVPPVLAPGETGYLVAGFTLVSPPADDAELQVAPAVSPASDAPVDLRVSAVRVAFPGDTVVATGDVQSPDGVAVTGGAVGVVLLDGSGKPIAAVLDRASAGRLGKGEARAFRAAEPPAPPVARADVGRRVTAAWGTPAP